MAQKHRQKISLPPPGPRLIGYARVSTVEQNLQMQVDALTRAGVHKDNLHVEKVSGAKAKRPVLEWAIQTLRPGDTFVVWKFDRIARSMQDMLAKLEAVKAEGAGFKSLTEQVDTTTPGGVFLMHILAAAAQFERDLIVQRTKEGVASAKARGVKFGQPRKIDPTTPEGKKQMKIIMDWRKQKVPVREIAERIKAEWGIEISHAAVQKYTQGLGRRRKPRKT